MNIRNNSSGGRISVVLITLIMSLPFLAGNAFAAKRVSGDPVNGANLFAAKCLMCHGEKAAGGFAQRSVKSANAGRISLAIQKRTDMNFLSYLTNVQLEDISAYLASTGSTKDDLPRVGDASKGKTAYKNSCSYCHTYGAGAADNKSVGPDLKEITTKFSSAYLGAWVSYPQEMIKAGAYSAEKMAQYPYAMPDLGHADIDVLDITTFLSEQDASLQNISDTPVKVLSDTEFKHTTQSYFNRCAGCHGLYRGGATGPNIGEARSKLIGTDGLAAMLRYGTPAGMPNFGTSGELTEAEIVNLAAYLQVPPPKAPELSMTEIQASWNLIKPVAERPSTPITSRNWKNYTGVILRDAGQVSIIDGDTKEEVVRLNTGFAVHILRSSASGRYFYAIGRDGLLSLIDLWPSIPETVAKVKGCHDARSVDGSKAVGWEDKYVIEGCYWPAQYVTYDGLTLEPLNLVSLKDADGTMKDINGDTILENRVAAIAASHTKPLWVIALKESGYVGIVDYSQAGHPMTSKLATEKFLHDGGFDHTGKYFMVAANASNKMVVIDLDNPAFVTSFTTGVKPHPGRGANWIDPEFGWVNATQHIGEPKISVYGADPANRPDIAWKVVREIAIPSAGSLFIKTHPNPKNPWVLVDMTLSSDINHQKQICAISKATAKVEKCITVASNGRAVHMEYNETGTEVWVSDWAYDGGVVILDAVTLTEKARIYGANTPSGQFITPTGKFNVTNTAGDIY